jgi:putative acetyltransferase
MEKTEIMGSDRRRIAQAAIVRPAARGDFDELVRQTWAVAAEGRWIGTEVPFDREARLGMLDRLSSDTLSALLVADTSAKGGPSVVGHIWIDVASYGVADIGMLIVAEWRGLGIGTMMLDAAIAWAIAAGAHKMALEVWPDNSAALDLYHRAGFIEEGRKLRHYKRRNGELWDSVLMGRPLL